MKYYDIGESIAGITSKLKIPSPEPDVDFIGVVEIKMEKNGCQRRLFTTESIKAGEVLLVNNALVFCDKLYSPFLDPMGFCDAHNYNHERLHTAKTRSNFLSGSWALP
jgi:hypothetical protein